MTPIRPSRLRALLAVFGAGRWRDVADVLAAEAALLHAQLLVWTRPTGRLVDREEGEGEGDASTDPAASDGSRERAARCARAITRAVRYGPYEPQCLVRAVALQRMLRARGIGGGRIRIGVRREEGSFVAHAWVERHGEVLADTVAITGSFVPFTDVKLR